ncbi:MAG: helix-turn-helix domain-containing protein [Candidatus Kerfeldbacteria bacterium]|nr:helix-turn-helix domain-containing protein [Candidatus Kerfeldbacteria bacterium]
MGNAIRRGLLQLLYLKEKQSKQEIADLLKCSVHRVSYWMDRYQIPTRTISDAVYAKKNPNGDPFKLNLPKTLTQAELFGMGMGLFWGEGNKVDRSSVRLGNTDPDLIITFIKFLETFFSIRKEDIRFGLQIFSDTSPQIAQRFWTKALGVNKSQFMKIIVTPPRSRGNYKRKSKYGVLTIYYLNSRLQKLLLSMLCKKSRFIVPL